MREILIQEIESIVGQKPNTHRDFAYISRLIAESTHEYISPTTLKRVWGKQHDYTRCSMYTLDILARYLGYGDYKSFCQGQKMESEPSEFFVCSYSSELLSIGDELCLEWMPNRRIIVRYLGNQKYVVTASQNAKLSVNDTFECISFLEGQAIQLSHLIHNGQGPYTYIAGKNHGVRITPIVHKDDANERNESLLSNCRVQHILCKDDEITPPNQLKPQLVRRCRKGGMNIVVFYIHKMWNVAKRAKARLCNIPHCIIEEAMLKGNLFYRKIIQ